jgi:hypothetical protein
MGVGVQRGTEAVMCAIVRVAAARMSAATSGAARGPFPDVAALIRASVTGLDESIPFLRYPLAGYVLLYGIGAWPSPDGVHRG